MKRIRISVLFFTIVLIANCDKGLFNKDRPTNGRAGHFSDFTSILPSKDDLVVLPQGFKFSIIISYGDTINGKGDTFGFNNDHVEFFPESFSAGEERQNSGFLFVSHEYYPAQSSPKSKDVVHLEKYTVGASIVRIHRDARGMWLFDRNYTGNRRFHAMSKLRMDGPVEAVLGKHVTGTMDNCSGGQTPWGTALSGEESTDYGTVRGWEDFKEEGVGWIVEFDPYDAKSTPVKHSAMGRFKHEGAAVTISKRGHAVVYMGEDRVSGGIYKFISDRKFNPANRRHNLNLLSSGRLFGARMTDPSKKNGKGRWIPVDIDHPDSGPKLRANGFVAQTEVLLDIERASKALEISEFDRPEDCEVHSADSTVYCAMTNNMKKIPPDLHGMIIKFIERNGDPESGSFDYETFVAGGEDSGLSSPDNLAFDSLGNLWVATDIFSPSINKLGWSFHGNNALFMIKTSGSDAGSAYRFASAPSGAEFTGPWFTKNDDTLFLSVQHPGEGGNPSSWPDGKARPSVIAVYRE